MGHSDEPVDFGSGPVSEQELFDFVEKAAEQAAQTVAAIHRRRLVTQSFIAALLAALLVSIVVALLIGRTVTADNRANSLYNCHLLTRADDILGKGDKTLKFRGHPEGLISSDAKLRKSQAFDAARIRKLRAGPLKTLLTDPVTEALSKASEKDNTDTVNYWQHTLIPALSALANINCQAAVR